MVQPLYYCLLLPVTLLAALCTDTGIIFKFVCIGDSVEVFQNITYTSLKTEITLYKTFEKTTETIALWVMQNFSYTDIIHGKYKQKVSLENGTILLQDFQASDEATYFILYNESSKKKYIQLCEHVPPTLLCKPNIKHEENFLIASLDNPEYCGKPLASVRWMEYPNISYRTKARIELLPGNEAGTYRACIEGETLKCVKNSSEWENCENVTIGSTREKSESHIETINIYSSPTISDIPQLKTINYVIVVIVSLVLFCVIAILTKLFWKRPEKPTSVETEQRTREQPSLQEPPLEERPLHDVSDFEAGPGDPERIPLAQAGGIELQLMGNVHH